VARLMLADALAGPIRCRLNSLDAAIRRSALLFPSELDCVRYSCRLCLGHAAVRLANASMKAHTRDSGHVHHVPLLLLVCSMHQARLTRAASGGAPTSAQFASEMPTPSGGTSPTGARPGFDVGLASKLCRT